ncbi:MAG: hypothetical protein Kow0025_20710 [Thermodesulfovibrionales bacterium]
MLGHLHDIAVVPEGAVEHLPEHRVITAKEYPFHTTQITATLVPPAAPKKIRKIRGIGPAGVPEGAVAGEYFPDFLGNISPCGEWPWGGPFEPAGGFPID